MALDNIGTHWTIQEVQEMENLLRHGLSYGEVAQKLGRSITAIVLRHRMVVYSNFINHAAKNVVAPTMTIMDYRRQFVQNVKRG